MINKVVHNLLFLAFRDPENMPRLHINDVGCILIPIVQLEFINAQKFRLLFGLDQLSIDCVLLLKPLLINILDRVFPQAGNSAYWYCEECGKYYSDAEGENEIALADTVISATCFSV